jgi:rRNA processing protein Krr1/Pno1
MRKGTRHTEQTKQRIIAAQHDSADEREQVRQLTRRQVTVYNRVFSRVGRTEALRIALREEPNG